MPRPLNLHGRVAVRQRTLRDGRQSVYFDAYQDGVRVTRTPGIYLTGNARMDREKLALARQGAHQWEIEIIRAGLNLGDVRQLDGAFLPFFATFAETRHRNYPAAHRKFRDYLAVERKSTLKFRQLTPELFNDFYTFLTAQGHTHNGARFLMQHVRTAIRAALLAELLPLSLYARLKLPKKRDVERTFLDVDELRLLARTPVSRRTQVVKDSWLFMALAGGLRMGDIEGLRWQQVGLGLDYLSVVGKGGKRRTVPIPEQARRFLPPRGKPGEKVFRLPKRSNYWHALQRWARAAGLSKHLHPHAARHSFATNALLYDGDLATVSNILGHASLQQTMGYVRVLDEQKRRAVESLPRISEG